MEKFIFIIIGIAGGVIGGMGMGGGTLLIPLLLIFTNLKQHSAQTINLLAFIPMAVVALAIHFKNKLVEFRFAVWAAVPAAVMGIGAAVLASKTDPERLKLFFGVFLLVLGVYQLGDAIYKKVKKAKATCNARQLHDAEH